MADQEVIKHTKKLDEILKSRQHSLLYKLKEILIEIFIIVFAVTLSIRLHDRSEHAHHQKLVKDFFAGIKTDLENDIVEMEDDLESYKLNKYAFEYMSGLRTAKEINEDSMDYYGNWIHNTIELNPNNGRFEGFKSSGNIGYIENTELQNDIMDFYQENSPILLGSTAVYVQKKERLFNFLIQKINTDSTGATNLSDVFISQEGHNICRSLIYIDEIIERYGICINKSKKIISAIKKEYKL